MLTLACLNVFKLLNAFSGVVLTTRVKNRCRKAKQKKNLYFFQNNVKIPSIHSKGPSFNAGPFECSADSQIYARLSVLMAFLHYFEFLFLFFPFIIFLSDTYF